MWWLWRLLLEEVVCRDKEKWYQCDNWAWFSREVYIKLYNTLRRVFLLSTHALPWMSLWNGAEGLLVIVELEEVSAVEALLLKSQDGYLGGQWQCCISNYEKPRNPFSISLGYCTEDSFLYFFPKKLYTFLTPESHPQWSEKQWVFCQLWSSRFPVSLEKIWYSDIKDNSCQ